jgi:thymidylate synthase ThyX
MNIKPRIYALKGLPPETIAVAFAKCSRSPEPFDKIAAELNNEKSSEFNEKWVVNYGHGSVAEHAFFNIAIEDVSLMAVENIQSNRLGSYTEKSSRYQVYERERVYIPEILYYEPELLNIYTKAVNGLFDVYERSLPLIKAEIELLYPNNNNDPEQVWQSKIKSKWIDICRFALPNCVLANLGVSMNARTWEYAITKMLSSPLKEVNSIGQKVKETALSITPTLVKYAEANEYYQNNEKYLYSKSRELSGDIELPEFTDDNPLSVELIDHDHDGENKILAALIYKSSSICFNDALKKARSMDNEEKARIFDNILKDAKNIYDKPPREFEYPYYTFDVLLDQGAYYDLKRNRIMTQTPQILSGRYGYYTPRVFDKVGMGKDYRRAMDFAHHSAMKIAEKYPYDAQYLTTKATARRFTMKMNLREAFYFIGLRSRQNGHFMYRKIAQLVFDAIDQIHPVVAKYIKVDKI